MFTPNLKKRKNTEENEDIKENQHQKKLVQPSLERFGFRNRAHENLCHAFANTHIGFPSNKNP